VVLVVVLAVQMVFHLEVLELLVKVMQVEMELLVVNGLLEAVVVLGGLEQTLLAHLVATAVLAFRRR
jgi:hypothetical protein